jgi:hypothetical protein
MRSDVLNKNSNAYDGKTRAEKIFEWDYISCAPPLVGNLGVSADGVMANGDKFSMLFPGPNGQLQPAMCCSIGAFTAVGMSPTVQGTVVATDTNSTVAGLNLQMDSETADAVGVEIIMGGSQFSSKSNKIIAGTHSSSFDVTINNADWTDYDCLTIGYRKVQEFQPGHGAILAASSGDPLYTDYVAFGCISPDDVQISTDLNDSGDETVTDSGDATAANHNHRFRVELASSGSVTYSHIGAAAMRDGLLAAPSTTASFTFDSGDVLVPYMFVLGTNQNSAVYLKSIDITRSPAIDGHSVA